MLRININRRSFLLKITFIMPADDLSGGNLVVATYAKILIERGHEVLVVHSPPPRLDTRGYLRAIRHMRWGQLMESFAGNAGHVSLFGVPQYVLSEERPVTAEDLPDADILIATWWETAVWMQAMPPSKGRKVHLIQGYEIWGTDAEGKDRVHAALRGDNLKIVISQGLKETLDSALGDLNLNVIPNAVDSQRFDAPKRTRNALPTLGFVYGQSNSKSADIYFSACELARRELPSLKILSFGLELPTKNLPLPPETDYVRRPTKAQIASIYASCDVWLFGSRIDSFGLPILEAMACRTPVIGVPVGAAPELLTGGAGVLIAPESPADMAKAIVEFFRQSPEEWETMSQRAYDRAHSYSWDDATDKLVSVLEVCVKRP